MQCAKENIYLREHGAFYSTEVYTIRITFLREKKQLFSTHVVSFFFFFRFLESQPLFCDSSRKSRFSNVYGERHECLTLAAKTRSRDSRSKAHREKRPNARPYRHYAGTTNRIFFLVSKTLDERAGPALETSVLVGRAYKSLRLQKSAAAGAFATYIICVTRRQ